MRHGGRPSPTHRAAKYRRKMNIGKMEHDVAHVSPAEAIRDIAAIPERVEKGAGVIVEKDRRAVALIRPAPQRQQKNNQGTTIVPIHRAGKGTRRGEGLRSDSR